MEEGFSRYEGENKGLTDQYTDYLRQNKGRFVSHDELAVFHGFPSKIPSISVHMKKQVQLARERMNTEKSCLLAVDYHEGVIFFDRNIEVGGEVTVPGVWKCEEYPELEQLALTGTVKAP